MSTIFFVPSALVFCLYCSHFFISSDIEPIFEGSGRKAPSCVARRREEIAWNDDTGTHRAITIRTPFIISMLRDEQTARLRSRRTTRLGGAVGRSRRAAVSLPWIRTLLLWQAPEMYVKSLKFK